VIKLAIINSWVQKRHRFLLERSQHVGSKQ